MLLDESLKESEMVHGLETLKRLNDEAAKLKKPTHALIYIAGVATGNTVFPNDRVMLFTGIEEAADFAVSQLLYNDQLMQDEHSCEFSINGEEWFDDALEVIDAWNNLNDGLLQVVGIEESEHHCPFQGND